MKPLNWPKVLVEPLPENSSTACSGQCSTTYSKIAPKRPSPPRKLLFLKCPLSFIAYSHTRYTTSDSTKVCRLQKHCQKCRLKNSANLKTLSAFLSNERSCLF